MDVNWNTAWKVWKYEVFSGPNFPVFGVNTEIYGVSLCFQSKCRKLRIRKNSVFGRFLRSATLCHLSNDQRERMEKFLVEECEVFTKDVNSISCIESLKPYHKISKQFYSELKQCLEDLLTIQLITNYRVPLTIVPRFAYAKRIKQWHLYIDYQEFNKKMLSDKIPLPRNQNILDNVGVTSILRNKMCTRHTIRGLWMRFWGTAPLLLLPGVYMKAAPFTLSLPTFYE